MSQSGSVHVSQFDLFIIKIVASIVTFYLSPTVGSYGGGGTGPSGHRLSSRSRSGSAPARKQSAKGRAQLVSVQGRKGKEDEEDNEAEVRRVHYFRLITLNMHNHHNAECRLILLFMLSSSSLH